MATHEAYENDVQVWLLGAFRLKVNAQVVPLPTHKSASLLAYLILFPGSHSREKLCTLFWGDSSEEKAHTSLRKALTFLRLALPGDLILADRETVQLRPNPQIWVDVFAFEQAARQYLADQTTISSQFNADLYPGDLLENFYDDWILPVREHLRIVYTDVLLRAIENARARSEYATAIDYARKVIQHDPANERAFQHLMICYILTGDRTGAIAQYRTCQRVLQNELGVEPSVETKALFDWIEQTTCRTLASRLTNLPVSISSFVGRERVLVQIRQAIGQARLVTLTGPGGSGKTRLAIQAATDMIDSYSEGVWWIELSPLVNAPMVPASTAKALGINPQPGETTEEALATFLASRNVLLVLDNCEHLLDACAALAENLLPVCPGLKILATSREALGVTGEIILHVPPLQLPEAADLSFADLLMQYEGIRLFVERAGAVRNRFALNDQNAHAVLQICQRLDGIPLAIELAAAQVKTLSVEQIADRLDDRFRLLGVENRSLNIRHRTLGAVMDWSFDLLSTRERALFRRLSIFHGGWTLDAAEAVCNGNGIASSEILDLLAHLADKSLVSVDENQRYSMLETIREYAAEKLTASGEKAWLNPQRLDYFLGLALTGDRKVRGSDQLTWIERLNNERSNFDSVLEMALEAPALQEKGCDLVSALAWYWGMIGDFHHAKKWVELYIIRCFDLAETEAWARLLYYAGSLSVWGMKWLDTTAALAMVEQSLQIWQRLSDRFNVETGQCLLTKGWIEAYEMGLPAGETLVKQAIDIFKDTGRTWWQAWALNLWVGIQQRNGADPHSILLNLDELLLLWPKTGDYFNAAINTLDKGILLMESGALDQAWEMMNDSLQTFRQFNAKGYLYQVLENLGDLSRMMDRHIQAAGYYKECISLAAALNWQHWLPDIYAGLGFAALHSGDDHCAGQYFRQALEQNHPLEDGSVLGIGGLAALKTVQNELPVAARLWGAFDATAAETQIKPVDRQEMAEYRSRCNELLNADDFEREWQAGRSMPFDEILSDSMGKNTTALD